ncbi:MAG TPA: cytidine deaminase [Nitrososphaerales archaeon]|nr:cytidine deaminase [Nitrososphaerales archaeon]
MPDSAKLRALVEAASNVRRNAYSPYSKVKIGAAVLTSKGKVYSGCNVENSSYGISCCAERNAIFKAVSEGERSIVAIAVYGESEGFTSPCGACRQVMAEFNPRMLVLRRGKDGFSEDTTAGALLPSHFNPEGLARR